MQNIRFQLLRPFFCMSSDGNCLQIAEVKYISASDFRPYTKRKILCKETENSESYCRSGRIIRGLCYPHRVGTGNCAEMERSDLLNRIVLPQTTNTSVVPEATVLTIDKQS
ncbi:hypothetical protein J6590_040681 [Homalodisca vitripennis]|nr:hypothetical protein J6590_040681 [Homalodisca vitripennis]